MEPADIALAAWAGDRPWFRQGGRRALWHQRLTAIALVPLGLWFVISVLAHIGAAAISSL